ncbi:MAG: 30S ribosomal protein S13 [Candidatus Diapherotrites archaeon]
MSEEKELRLIVRVMGKDLDGNLTLERGLRKIKGIGQRMAKGISFAFEQKFGFKHDEKLGYMGEDLDKKLEEIILRPEGNGMPQWMLNRRGDFETGKNAHHVMNDLDFDIRKDLERMKKIRSYKGIRHMYGLPVRGQRTRSSFRQRGSVVGVVKKEAKAAMAPKKGEAPAKEKK